MEFYPVTAVGQGQLSVMPMPGKTGSLTEDIQKLKEKGVTHVVSFLESHELEKLGLQDEEKLLEEVGITYLNFPVQDHHTPTDKKKAQAFAHRLFTNLEKGGHLALHCKGGTGRTGTFAGALLKIAGFDEKNIFSLLSEARGKKMPATEEQKLWALSID